MGSSLDALNAHSSLTARRQAASNLPAFELPPPSNLQFTSSMSQKFPSLSNINATQPSTTNVRVGNLPTPPSNPTSDATNTQVSLPSTSQHGPILPYTPTFYGTTPNGFHTGFAPQPWQGINPLFPIRPAFSPSLGSLVRNSSGSPTAGESQTLPPPPYEMNMNISALPPFTTLSPPSSASPASVQQQHQHSQQQQNQQHTASNSLINSQNGGRIPSQSSSDPTVEKLNKLNTTPSMYSNSQPPSLSQHSSSYSYSGPSPIQQTSHSGGTPVSRVSPPLNHTPVSQAQQQQQHSPFVRAPYPSYSMPAMPGPVMTNVHSPGAQMSMIGSLQNMLPPNFNSGYAANPQNIYGNPRAHSPPQVPNDRPFKCDQCPQSFNRNHDLKRHKRIHLAVKPFPCNHCDKSFSRKDALKRHILVKGCGKRGSVEASGKEEGIKSESGSDDAGESPLTTEKTLA